MRLFLSILIVTSLQCVAQEEADAIKKRAEEFSQLLMEGKRAEVVAMYTTDAKILPPGLEILDGEELANYWNPANSSSKILYHKITPVEIKVIGDEAYDYGYYEGRSKSTDSETTWRGKYLIIWKKVEGTWKMYLDSWSRIN